MLESHRPIAVNLCRLKLDCNSSYNRVDSNLGARSINAYKVDAIRQSRRYTNVTENGLAIGSGLPLPIGRSVEVIITEHRLEVLQTEPGGALPGQAIAVLDPQQEMVVDVFPEEDRVSSHLAPIPKYHLKSSN